MNRPSKIASFDVDAQKGFTPLCPDELPVPGGDAIGAALNQLASRAALRLGSKDAHSPKAAWVVESAEQMLRPLAYPDADLTWVSHCVPGTPGFGCSTNCRGRSTTTSSSGRAWSRTCIPTAPATTIWRNAAAPGSSNT